MGRRDNVGGKVEDLRGFSDYLEVVEKMEVTKDSNCFH